MKEHFTKGGIDHCPVCGTDTSDGYNSLEFVPGAVSVEYRCPDCGTKFYEQYEYVGTYQYKEE